MVCDNDVSATGINGQCNVPDSIHWTGQMTAEQFLRLERLAEFFISVLSIIVIEA